MRFPSQIPKQDSRTEAKQTSETTRASPAARYSTRREQGKHTCPRKDGRREPGTRGMVCQTVDGTAEIRCGDERNSCSNTRVNGIPERWRDAMSHWCGGGRACGGTSHKEPLKETQKGWRNPAPPGGKRQPCCAVVGRTPCARIDHTAETAEKRMNLTLHVAPRCMLSPCMRPVCAR